MCRWGCAGINSMKDGVPVSSSRKGNIQHAVTENRLRQTFMCKWCGTRYCRDCLHGEFSGLMRDSTQCAKCNQKKCQGKKVEAVLKQYLTDDESKKGSRGGSSRSRSASPAKRSKSSSSAGGGKKSGTGKSKSKSGGKKGGKKKKKKK